MKRLSYLFLFLFATNATAQDDLLKNLPVDQAVRTGTLANGMKYYIRYNAKPEHRAELRMAVNAGSTSENDDQQGLAHFTEHMAFNGTKNFKKSELVDYLESVGTKFGPHLNAYTSFDETVYMLQIPTDSASIIEKAMQILEDWSHNVIFDSIEVEKERGVVVEEWRLGQGANERMRRKYWPVLFKDSRYAERLPIGKKEIIEGCRQGVLRDFYSDWYHPGLQALVAVGDFDLDKMEKMIKEKFSSIPEKQNARPVQAFQVPDNNDLLVTTATDKEATISIIQVFFKQQVEKQVSVGDYRRGIAQQLYTSMLNARFAELQRLAEPPYVFAASNYSDLVRNKNAYFSFAACKEDGIEKALNTLLTENERVRRFGFTQTELDRQKNEYLRGMEKAYNEKDKTESRSFSDEYVRNFLVQEPMPGIEAEYDMAKKLVPGITLDEINAFSKKWITDGTNAVVVITAPEKETTKMPNEQKVQELFKSSRTMELKPYEDKVLNKPLIEKMPSPGTVAETKEIMEFGITEWKLNNGARVVIKPTDFKNDEIIFSASSYGGSSLVEDKDYISAAMADALIDQSGLGEFDGNAIQKYLSGKIANVSPSIGGITEGFNGSCAPKDLETMMQMLHMYFQGPRKDSTAFQSLMKQRQTFIANKNSDPASIFRDTVNYFWNNYHFRSRPLSLEILNEASLDRAYQIYKKRFSDASNFMFFFVGNFKPEELKPLVEKYIGGLPSTHHNETFKDLGITHPAGIVSKEVKRGIEPKSQVIMRFHMPFEYNRKNRNEVTALIKLVSIKLRESLREDKSGVYGVGCTPNISHYPKSSLEININFSCSPENVDMLVKASLDVLEEVRKNGCDEKNLVKVKETALRERETSLKENGFWLGAISSSYMNNEDILELNQYTAWVNSLKGDDFKVFSSKYLKADNYAKFVLNPEK